MKHQIKTTDTVNSAGSGGTEPTLKETAEDLYELVSGQVKSFEEEFMRARAFVQKNPVISIIGATAIGYFLGKLFRKKKIIYIEKRKP